MAQGGAVLKYGGGPIPPAAVPAREHGGQVPHAHVPVVGAREDAVRVRGGAAGEAAHAPRVPVQVGEQVERLRGARAQPRVRGEIKARSRGG